MAGGRQGTQAVVVDTKLNLPTQRAGVVMRDDLIKRMLDAEVPVVSVSAPAGFGKTTLLVQYAEATGRPVAWISLDAADNDAALFMLEIGTALDRISPIDTQSRRHLAALTDNVSTAVAVLVRLLAAHPGLVLMFDDAHLVDNRVTLELIATLSERLPHGCQLVVGSRTSIPVPLPRLRARGLVLELGQRELALDRHEAGALLEGAGSGLPSDSFEALYSRVEGWAAGMYLAALCLRGVDDPNRAVRDFAGNHRDIVDYLSSEVLAGLPDDRLSFLLHTSVLDRFTASMCDAVLERHDSAQVIEDLEKINLFVIPLDNRREWYRYHHLFSDMLRAGLARRDPASERAIHRRATAWHEQHGTVPEAIEHAFAAGERARAAELVTSHARTLFNVGLQLTIERWLEAFSDEEAAAYPPLAIIGAWAGGLLGNPDRSRRYVELVEGATFDGPLPLDEISLESAIAALRAAHGWDGVGSMRAYGEIAYKLEPVGGLPRRRAASFFGAGLLLSGRSAEAMGPLSEGAVLRDEGANTAIFSLGLLGQIAFDAGRLEEAEASLKQGYELIEQRGMQDYILAGATYAGLASLAVGRRDFDAVAPHLERIVALISRASSWPWWSIYLGVVGGRIALAIGELDLGSSLLERARSELARYPDAGILPALLAKEERELQAARSGKGLLREPITDAEMRVVVLLPTHFTIEEIGHRLFISRNTVKAHLRSIYRKLEVTSRAEAVAATRALGLDRIAPSG